MILSPEPLNVYSLAVKWSTVGLLLIFKFILGFNAQSIGFTNSIAWLYIPKEEQVLI